MIKTLVNFLYIGKTVFEELTGFSSFLPKSLALVMIVLKTTTVVTSKFIICWNIVSAESFFGNRMNHRDSKLLLKVYHWHLKNNVKHTIDQHLDSKTDAQCNLCRQELRIFSAKLSALGNNANNADNVWPKSRNFKYARKAQLNSAT